MIILIFFFFFFNDTATTEIYTLSLHDALPISRTTSPPKKRASPLPTRPPFRAPSWMRKEPRSCSGDRKSTRLNSSHLVISYAVFCLKKKKKYFNYEFVVYYNDSPSYTYRCIDV